jgi:hypothetical protein
MRPARWVPRAIAVAAVAALLAGCSPNVPSPATSPTPSPAPATPSAQATPTATSSPSALPSPPAVVDATTMDGKLLMGYQGWFSCPSDGTGTAWFHWFNANVPDAAHFRVDMYPDASELTDAEKCGTSMKFPNGDPAPVYSAANPLTVARHFQWMREYGIDGVFLQRFLTEQSDPALVKKKNIVLDNVRAAAEANGRVFAIEIDISNPKFDSKLVDEIEADWKYLVDVKKVTESPAYLHQYGTPVVGIYGFGLNLYPTTPAQAMAVVDFFENNPEPRYRATLMGGVPNSWRTLSGDALTDPAWANYYCSLDVISPWTVGRFATQSGADTYKSKMVADMARATDCGAEYMPVVYPGTAFHNNWAASGDTTSPTAFNLIPRMGGRFYWRQVYNAVSIGAPMIFNAMFDEVDEDTAMFKVAATVNDQPAGVQLLSLDADGESLPSDWYLRLGGAATMMLRGDIPLTPSIPLAKDGSLVSAFATPEPSPRETRARIEIQTTSDWTTLDLVDAQWGRPTLVSASPGAVVTADQFPLALGQSSDRATAGQKVEMVVDVALLNLPTNKRLTFEIQRGSVGKTTVTLMNYVGDAPKELRTVEWAGQDASGRNPYRFSLLSDSFLVVLP